MKKVFMSFVLVFAALIVSCGGSNGGSKDNGGETQQQDTLEGQKCYEEGIYSCEQNDKIVLLCDDGKWFKLKQCSETQTCNSNTGNCDNQNDNENGNEEENGGSNEEENSGGNNGGGSSSECTSGEFKCVGDESHYCNSNSSWVYDARCENGCNSSTGRCNSSSGDNGGNNGGNEGGNNGGGNGGGNSDSCNDIMNCFLPANQAKDQAAMQACVDAGSQKAQSIFMSWYNCIYENQCQEVNCQQCINEYSTCINDSNSGGNGGGGSTPECTSGEYKCEGTASYSCSNGFWEHFADCSETGCNTATGQCNEAECQNGQKTCSDSTLYQCSGSKWVTLQQCQYGCSGGSASPECAICKLGDIRCNGSVYQLCGHGGAEWLDEADCSASQIYDGCYPGKGCGCNQGRRKCLTTSSGATYSGYCSNGTSYMGSGTEECTNGCNSSTGKCR